MAENNQNGIGRNDQQNSGKSRRGFAAMDRDRQREIAARGGRVAHERGTAHEFNSEEAREAGRKGGRASGGNNRPNINQSEIEGGNE